MTTINYEHFLPLRKDDYMSVSSLAKQLRGYMISEQSIRRAIKRYEHELPDRMLQIRKDSLQKYIHWRMFLCWILDLESLPGIGFDEQAADALSAA